MAKKSKSPARVKALKKAVGYTLRSKYSKQPKGEETPAWRDMKSQASRVLRQRRPRSHKE